MHRINMYEPLAKPALWRKRVAKGIVSVAAITVGGVVLVGAWHTWPESGYVFAMTVGTGALLWALAELELNW